MENFDQSDKRETVSSYYDNFSTSQVNTGINLRHYKVFNKCIEAGLRKDSKVLEIGCGIGTFTHLIARYVKKGTITATDISSESIRIAKANERKSANINFLVSDMTDFKSDTKFDFVVMVDVLEHIPLQQYDQLFSMIDRYTHPNSILAMNIPHPDMIKYLRKHSPEKLQIIDNSIEMDFLSDKIYQHNFHLQSYSSYCINNYDHDYVFMIFEKNDKTKQINEIPRIRIIFNKFYYKLKYLFATI